MMRSTLPAEALSDLIGSIYDCAIDPGLWPDTLTKIRLALDFRNAVMGLMALPSGEQLLTVASGIEPPWLERMADYGAEVVEQWGGAEEFDNHPLAEPAVLSWRRPRSEIEANRYYREWAAPQGVVDVVGITLARDSATVGTIGLGRHVSAGEIGEREVDALRLLVPHIQRTVAISRVLDLKAVVAASFAAALDAVSAAIVLVDAELRIVNANKAAQAMLAKGDPIVDERGMLATRSRPANAALGLAVRQAAQEESGMGRRGFGIPAPRADGDPSVLHVLPLRHGSLRPGLTPNAAAAVFVAPAVTPMPAPSEALAALFDLTAAEARVFSLIASGMTLAEVAGRLGIGASTAKTHLLRLFSKTGTGRQAELIKLASSLSLPV